MKTLRKKMLRTFCVLTAALSIFALSACDLMAEFTVDETPADSSSNAGNSSKPWEDWGQDEDTPTKPTPENPNENKTVAREELDEIGHKVVYYTDGTWEDLGRAVPLNTASPAPETQYGYQSLKKEADGEGLCALYQDLYEVSTAFHTSTVDLNSQDGICEVAVLPYNQYGITAEQAISVWKVFGAENPAYYWISPVVSYTSKHLYFLADEAYAKASTRSAIRKSIEEVALDCDTYLSGKTSLEERALTIYDYLIYKLDYAYKADGITPETAAWAHNIVGLTMGKGVCETYAEAFDYFCGLFGLDCMTVTGMATQDGVPVGHAWNYLSFGKDWYAVDVTWGEQECLLRSWFGKEKNEFLSLHEATTPDVGWGIDYQCALPTLAEGNLCPVLFSDGESEGIFVSSVDKAFTLMTNEQGRYEITLYPDTTVTARNDIDIYPLEAAFCTALPKAQSITFIAERLYVEGNHYYQPEISTDNALTLQSSIFLKDVELKAPSIKKNGHLLLPI
ncbi:MAG: hypothetical protein E7380_01680 [Clostridiales bacterium]|nr:hypothetical protein [Clostridiales bacterium]